MEWEFTEENKERCKGIIAQYPDGHQQAAAIPLLDLGTFTFTFKHPTPRSRYFHFHINKSFLNIDTFTLSLFLILVFSFLNCSPQLTLYELPFITHPVSPI